FRLDAFHFFGDAARFGLLRLGLVFFAFAHQRADFLTEAVAGGVQLVALADQGAAHAVPLREIVQQRGIEIAGREFFAHQVEILSHKMNIEHNLSFQNKPKQYAWRGNVSRREFLRIIERRTYRSYKSSTSHKTHENANCDYRSRACRSAPRSSAQWK